ncbi:DUF3152 domain-containing protein [Actinotalea sp. BY-33]|uniref:DUF3152 domain-containing protein n=2 Tax=Actinotalea soli TaxID=2819234 RepID=A0A939LTJ3_9CELL|nr:DUF3152 domain-containing protein [Actinotalea soli]
MTLATAGILSLGAGLGAGAALDRVVGPQPQASALGVISPDDAREAVGTPSPTPAPAPAEDAAAAGQGLWRVDGSGLPEVPDPVELVPPTPLPAPTPVEPEPDPDAVDADGLTLADREAGLLSTDVPETGSGELVVVPGEQEAPDPTRPVQTVRVEVEEGLDIDPQLFGATVMRILNDPRGWGADGSVSFARTDGEAQHRVQLVSPGTVDQTCAPLDTRGLYSCAIAGKAVINHMRWVRATTEFEDRTQYREYLINHEVGHLLGHGHVDCPAEGELAPLMQQQTVEVAPCVPNGWPFPEVEVPGET